MKRRLDNHCRWTRCASSVRCDGCGPLIRMRFLASARPLCQVEITKEEEEIRCYLYDGSDLYPETQTRLEPRLLSLCESELRNFYFYYH